MPDPSGGKEVSNVLTVIKNKVSKDTVKKGKESMQKKNQDTAKKGKESPQKKQGTVNKNNVKNDVKNDVKKGTKPEHTANK